MGCHGTGPLTGKQGDNSGIGASGEGLRWGLEIRYLAVMRWEFECVLRGEDSVRDIGDIGG